MPHAHSQSPPKDLLCHNGCLVLIRCLLLHVTVVRALLGFVPEGLLGVLGVYVAGVITGPPRSGRWRSAWRWVGSRTMP